MRTTSIITVENPLGIDQTWSASAPSAYWAQNIRYVQRGSWRESGGLDSVVQPVGEGGAPLNDSTIETMHWWSQHNGARRWLMFEYSNDSSGTGVKKNYLCAYTPNATPAYQVIDSERTYIDGPWQRTQYVANAGWVYFANGYDEVKRWDGTKTVKVGFDRAPRAPIVADQNIDVTQEDRTCRPIGFWLYDPTTLVDRELDVYVGESICQYLGWQTIDPEPRNKPIEVLADQQRGVGVPHVETFPEPLWRYGYAISWINDLGMESPLSELTFASGKSLGFSGKRQVCVQFEDAPEHVVAVRLYRTVNLRTPISSNYNEYDSEEDAGITSGKYRFELNYGDSTLQAYGFEAFRSQRTNINESNRQDFQVFLLETFQSGAPLQYIDDSPDSELGPLFNPANVGEVPRGLKFMKMFKGTLFVGGCQEFPDRVFYSAPLYVEQFPKENFMQIGDRDSGSVTGMYASDNTLVVFKQRGIYLVKGNPRNGFYTQTLTEEIGCGSPNSIVSTPLGLVFATINGIYLLSGFDNSSTAPSLKHISTSIQKIWDQRVFTQDLMSAQGTINYEDQEVWIQLIADGSNNPNLGLVWHYGAGGTWSVREGYPVNCWASSRDEYQYLYAGSWIQDPSASGVLHYSHASSVIPKAGAVTAVTPQYTTSWLSFGNRYDRTMVLHFQPVMVDYGTDANILGAWYEGRNIKQIAGREGVLYTNPEFPQLSWANGVWGGVTYGDYRSNILRFDTTSNGSPILAFESAFLLTSQVGENQYGRFELISYDLEVAPSKSPTHIKKLTPEKV